MARDRLARRAPRPLAAALALATLLFALPAPAVREPDSLLTLGGWPCLVVAVDDPVAARSMLVAIRAEAESEVGAWRGALPSWGERNRSAVEDGLWEYALVEPTPPAGPDSGASEILAFLKGERDLPAPADAPKGLLLFEIARRDLFALRLSKPNAEQARLARVALAAFRRPAQPIHDGAILLDAAGRFDGKPALEVRGPAWGTPASAAFTLQCARIGQALAPERIARLRVEPDAPRLVVYNGQDLFESEYQSWIDDAIDDSAAAVASTPWQADFDLLRDRVRLLRARNFESPGTRLDFLARRLVALPPEVVFAEDRLLEAATPDDWRDAARRVFDAPVWQAWIPTERSDEQATQPASDAPVLFQTRRFYTFVHRRAEGDMASVCLMVGLPGSLEQGGPPLRESRWHGGTRAAAPVAATRSQAAELWWTLAAGNRSFLSDGRRLDVFLPSPLPGAGSDPFAANQYSAVAFQAESRNVGELIHVAAEFLARPPALPFGAASSPIDRSLLVETPEYAASIAALAEQRRLMAGTSAEALFAAQMEPWHGLDEPERMFATLFNPANLVIAVSAPVDAEAVAAYFDRAMEPLMGRGVGAENHETPRAASPWPRPTASPADAPLPAPRRWWRVIEGDDPSVHAASLLLGPALSGQLRLQGRGAWTFATLEFPDFLLLYGATPESWTSAAARDADLRAIDGALRTLASTPSDALAPAVEQLRETAARSRALRDAQSVRRTFSLARNALMRGDPFYSDGVDDALAKTTAADVAALAKRLAPAE